MYKNSYQKCKFYAQGKCTFGNNCKFSHQGFKQIYLLRHAQSVFNSFSDKMIGPGFLSQQAKMTFQMNQQLIDCGLTQLGMKQAMNLKIPQDCYEIKQQTKDGHNITYKSIDIVFVSPLNRALQTAQTTLKQNKIRAHRVIVLPQLSQVLSKICDFSLPTDQKKNKYKKYDFHQLQNLQKLLDKKGSFWQDILVDFQHQKYIVGQKPEGRRYLEILDRIFPTPLQNSQSCFKRSMQALRKINLIAQKYHANKILVVSHNRILKYICGRNNGGRAESFGNCEMRRILLQQQES